VRIVRLRDTGSMLVSDGIVFGGRYVNPIDSDDYEEGGRLAFGPDGDLYVATGDSHRPELAQDLNSLNGKILRLRVPGTDADFTAPADNPFADQGGTAVLVWSLGHREPRGLSDRAKTTPRRWGSRATTSRRPSPSRSAVATALNDQPRGRVMRLGTSTGAMAGTAPSTSTVRRRRGGGCHARSQREDADRRHAPPPSAHRASLARPRTGDHRTSRTGGSCSVKAARRHARGAGRRSHRGRAQGQAISAAANPSPARVERVARPRSPAAHVGLPGSPGSSDYGRVPRRSSL